MAEIRGPYIENLQPLDVKMSPWLSETIGYKPVEMKRTASLKGDTDHQHPNRIRRIDEDPRFLEEVAKVLRTASAYVGETGLSAYAEGNPQDPYSFSPYTGWGDDYSDRRYRGGNQDSSGYDETNARRYYDYNDPMYGRNYPPSATNLVIDIPQKPNSDPIDGRYDTRRVNEGHDDAALNDAIQDMINSGYNPMGGPESFESLDDYDFEVPQKPIPGHRLGSMAESVGTYISAKKNPVPKGKKVDFEPGKVKTVDESTGTVKNAAFTALDITDME